jgi:hypothetical protein
MKKAVIFFSVFISSIVQAQYTPIINSNRPGESMTAFAVGRHMLQVETGVYGLLEEHSRLITNTNGIGAELNIRYGNFDDRLEFVLQTNTIYDAFNSPLVQEKRFGIKAANLGAKFLVFDPFKNKKDDWNMYSWKANKKFKWKQFIPAVAVYAGANFNYETNRFYPIVVDENIITPRATLITQNQFGTSTVFVTNWFWDKFGSPYENKGFIATLTNSFGKKYMIMLEVKAIQGDYYSDQILTAGFAYLLKDNIQLDLNISKNFKDTPDLLYGGVGMSYRFDLGRDEKLGKQKGGFKSGGKNNNKKFSLKNIFKKKS